MQIAVLRAVLVTALMMLAGGTAATAQEFAQPPDSNVAIPAAPQSQIPQASAPAIPTMDTHRFWDRENDLLFAGVGAARFLDYASTLNLRRRGDNEIFLTNSVVDNHPLFVGIEVAATAASIGVSYLFHRTGHHRLERWTSIVHFGVAVGGAVRNYSLKTAHNN